MNSITRKRIWPLALMPLAILGVVAVVVALSAMAPQTTQAQTAAADCAAVTDPVERAQCQTCQSGSGSDIWNTSTGMCEMPRNDHSQSFPVPRRPPMRVSAPPAAVVPLTALLSSRPPAWCRTCRCTLMTTV